MGFFDPPHIKIMEWSPQHFRTFAHQALPMIDGLITATGAPDSGRKLFRTAVIGTLASHAADAWPGQFSRDGLQKIEIYTRNAWNLMPQAYRGHIVPIAQAVLDAVGDEIAAAKHGRSARGEPAEGYLG